jgi:opacity protein-like surface antigen
MKLKSFCLGLAAVLAWSGAAHAQGFGFGAGLKERGVADAMPLPPYGSGLRDVADIPAPIPVPAPVPVPEGFTYYLRGDLGWAWNASNPSFSESGLLYGEDSATGIFRTSAIPLTSSHDGVFGGTIGFGAYFTPRLRGDLTLDFRGPKESDYAGSYNYATTNPGETVSGRFTDQLKVTSTVGLANLYFDLLPRGWFTPYIGAGIGFTYNRVERAYLNNEEVTNGGGTTPFSRVGSGKADNFGLAAAAMGGVTFAFDHRWAIDINYRALYLDGTTVAMTTNSLVTGNPQTSTVKLGDVWEHQVRVGLRFNIW